MTTDATANQRHDDVASANAQGVRDEDALRSAAVREADVLRTAGQRQINQIWEVTQAMIALSVIWTALFIAAYLAMLAAVGTSTDQQMSASTTAFMLLSNLAALVIGFYFGRTNHQRVGGATTSAERDAGR